MTPFTTSRIVPYRTALVPLARVEAIPPREASAPGSTGKNSPVSRRCAFSCLRVTPAWTVHSMSSTLTSSTASICAVLRATPPRRKARWPSRLVSAPVEASATRSSVHTSTHRATSSVERGKATRSGGKTPSMWGW